MRRLVRRVAGVAGPRPAVPLCVRKRPHLGAQHVTLGRPHLSVERGAEPRRTYKRGGALLWSEAFGRDAGVLLDQPAVENGRLLGMERAMESRGKASRMTIVYLTSTRAVRRAGCHGCARSRSSPATGRGRSARPSPPRRGARGGSPPLWIAEADVAVCEGLCELADAAVIVREQLSRR